MNGNSDNYRVVKRTMDVVLSFIGLVVLAPVFTLVAIGVAIRIGRPVFFRQRRPGLDGRIFELLKFRTMTDARDANGRLRDDHERLTKFGTFLRHSSLDELPELWCVLRGDMSLVGPRPLLVEYLPLYTPTQARRHVVRPGITGWAQINGRNELSWEDKFELDLWYVDHASLRLDAVILARTLLKVVQREGITQPGHVTAKPFAGTPESRI